MTHTLGGYGLNKYFRLVLSYKKIILFVLLCFCVFIKVQSQPLLGLSEKEDEYDAKNFVAVLEDTTGILTFDQVKSFDYSSKFLPTSKDVLHFGINTNTYWIRFRIRDLSRLKRRADWMMWIDFPILDSLTFYQINSDGSVADPIETGFLLPFDSRQVDHTTFAFPLYFSDNNPYEFYIKVVSKKAKMLPIKILKKDEFYQYKSNNDVYYGMFFGVIVVMVLYNLFIFVSLKDRSYLFYVLSILSTGLFFAGTSGYLFQYIHPNLPELNGVLLIILSACVSLFSSIFAQKFLETKRNLRIMHRFFHLIIGVSILCILMCLLGINIMFYSLVMYFTLLAFIIGLLITGVILWRRGNKAALYFTTAWFAYMVGGMAVIFVNLNIIKYNFIIRHGAEIGAMLEVIILSLALSEKYKRIKAEKESNARRIIDMQKQAQETLEEKVQERTVELQETNEELNQVVEELNISNERLSTINEELAKKNKKVTDSINYARRIQNAILPFPDRVSSYVKDHFILYKPRDIVSGDFYWLEEIEDKLIIICADCTGHGVPGAFMSLLGSDAITNTVINHETTSPSKILKYIDLDIQSILQQDKTSIKDGIDMSVCVIDKKNHTLEFAGAKSQIIYMQDGELNLLKGSKFSIGGKSSRHVKKFSSVTISLDRPTSLYLFTDGFPDQFGGPDNRKYMIKRFKEKISEIHVDPMVIQKQRLEQTLANWMGDHRQIDDITVMAFRFERGVSV